MELTKQERGCWIVNAYAPPGVSMRDANAAINAFVADERRGLALFHDHFADRAGGVAVFAVETPAALAALREAGPLEGSDMALHPLIFAQSALHFPSQVDFTMSVYRGRRLRDLMAEYEQSELARRNDER
jgi:hypothetical protein